VGVGRHLAIEPPPSPPGAPDPDPPARTGPPRPGTGHGGGAHAEPAPQADGVPLVAGYRLRLAVITAARHADVPTTAALLHQAQRQGLDATWLLAVAARHWPPPRLPVRVGRAGRR
jgi:hypothetical protein